MSRTDSTIADKAQLFLTQAIDQYHQEERTLKQDDIYKDFERAQQSQTRTSCLMTGDRSIHIAAEADKFETWTDTDDWIKKTLQCDDDVYDCWKKFFLQGEGLINIHLIEKAINSPSQHHQHLQRPSIFDNDRSSYYLHMSSKKLNLTVTELVLLMDEKSDSHHITTGNLNLSMSCPILISYTVSYSSIHRTKEKADESKEKDQEAEVTTKPYNLFGLQEQLAILSGDLSVADYFKTYGKRHVACMIEQLQALDHKSTGSDSFKATYKDFLIKQLQEVESKIKEGVRVPLSIIKKINSLQLEGNNYFTLSRLKDSMIGKIDFFESKPGQSTNQLIPATGALLKECLEQIGNLDNLEKLHQLANAILKYTGDSDTNFFEKIIELSSDTIKSDFQNSINAIIHRCFMHHLDSILKSLMVSETSCKKFFTLLKGNHSLLKTDDLQKLIALFLKVKEKKSFNNNQFIKKELAGMYKSIYLRKKNQPKKKNATSNQRLIQQHTHADVKQSRIGQRLDKEPTRLSADQLKKTSEEKPKEKSSCYSSKFFTRKSELESKIIINSVIRCLEKYIRESSTIIQSHGKKRAIYLLNTLQQRGDDKFLSSLLSFLRSGQIKKLDSIKFLNRRFRVFGCSNPSKDNSLISIIAAAINKNRHLFIGREVKRELKEISNLCQKKYTKHETAKNQR